MDAILSPFFLLIIIVFLIKFPAQSKSEISLENTKYFRKMIDNGDSLAAEDIISSRVVDSQVDCSFDCLKEGKCVGFNYRHESNNKYAKNCQISNKTKSELSERAGGNRAWTFYQDLKTLNFQTKETNKDTDNSGVGNEKLDNLKSCKELYKTMPNRGNGYYKLPALEAYCDLSDNGWTLIARFSNTDFKHWIRNGSFWYDQETPYGDVSSPSHNMDMISTAFWKVKGDEFKITRSDDPSHTALLQTTSNCLQGITFRSKVTSYGIFRNGIAWASDQCQGRCNVTYGGQYITTAGFGHHNCSSNLQSSNYIGFWCDWEYDGAVMMIGGGGVDCNRADHGVGITEQDSAMFGTGKDHHDFGDINNYTSNAPATYSLNLWVR